MQNAIKRKLGACFTVETQGEDKLLATCNTNAAVVFLLPLRGTNIFNNSTKYRFNGLSNPQDQSITLQSPRRGRGLGGGVGVGGRASAPHYFENYKELVR